MTENVNLNVNLTEDSCVFIDLAPAYTSYMEHEIIKTEHEIIKTEHEIIKTEHEIIKTEHEIIKTEHEIIKTEHEIIKTVAKTLLVLENQEDLYHAESRRWR